MKTTVKKTVCIALACCFLLFAASFSTAAKVRISSTNKTITVGKTFSLKVFNTKKTVRWSTTNSKVAKIKAKYGKNKIRATIKGLKKGTATIKAKVGNKTYKCKVTVKQKSSGGTSGTIVYITDTGEKYHVSGCRCLRYSKTQISLSAAKAQGYKPCGLCHPPT